VLSLAKSAFHSSGGASISLFWPRFFRLVLDPHPGPLMTFPPFLFYRSGLCEGGGMGIDATVPVGLDRATVQVLSRRSDWHGLGQLGAHLALLGVTGYLIWASRGGPWLAAAILLHGVVLDFLFCALHESIHRTAFATRWLNDAVAFLCGVLLMLPCDYFRLFHFAHHRFTQDPLKDPELSAKKPSSIGAYLWLASGLPNWWKRLTVTLRHALTGAGAGTLRAAIQASRNRTGGASRLGHLRGGGGDLADPMAR
jgi:hypothetical protein